MKVRVVEDQIPMPVEMFGVFNAGEVLVGLFVDKFDAGYFANQRADRTGYEHTVKKVMVEP